MKLPKVSILTVTFDKDLHWFGQSYASYKAFCKNYHSYNVVLDTHKNDCNQSKQYCESEGIDFHIDSEAEKVPVGYVRQQYMKFYADKYVPEDTEWICHVDSDSIFYEEHDPSIYFHEGKPIMLYTPYSAFGPGEIGEWQDLTTQALKLSSPIEHEFMRRMPLLYPKWLTIEMRQWFLKNHNMSILEYLSKVDNFTEYNFMGAYCWLHHRYLYHWVDTTSHHWQNFPFLQENSHGNFLQKNQLINNLIGVPHIHKIVKSMIIAARENGHTFHNIPELHALDYRCEHLINLYRDILIKIHPHTERDWPIETIGKNQLQNEI